MLRRQSGVLRTPGSADRRRITGGDVPARLMPRLVVHRPAARGAAGDRPMTAPPRPGRTSWRALARVPGHEDSGRPPWVPVLAGERIRPPARAYDLLH